MHCNANCIKHSIGYQAFKKMSFECLVFNKTKEEQKDLNPNTKFSVDVNHARVNDHKILVLLHGALLKACMHFLLEYFPKLQWCI